MFGIEQMSRDIRSLTITVDRLSNSLQAQNGLITEQTNLYKERGLKNTKKLLLEIRGLKSKKEVNKHIDKILLDIEEQMK